MIHYVLDHGTLVQGLRSDSGSTENQRSEFSSLVNSAFRMRFGLHVPAVGFGSLREASPEVHDYWLRTMFAAPDGALTIAGLERTPRTSMVRDSLPNLDAATFHAVAVAVSHGWPILTLDPDAYSGLPVDVSPL